MKTYKNMPNTLFQKPLMNSNVLHTEIGMLYYEIHIVT